MAVVLGREFNVRGQLISFDVFPVEKIDSRDGIDQANSFAIYNEGYKEQMGLPRSENFKINFFPVTFLVGNVETVEKIGYVAMGNAKETMENEYNKRASYEGPDGPLGVVPAFIVTSGRSRKSDKVSKPLHPVSPEAEDPTLRQLYARGQLSEIVRWAFSGETDGPKPGPVLDKKNRPILNAHQKPIVIRTLTDLHEFVNYIGPEKISKTVHNMGDTLAKKAIDELDAALKMYPQ